MAHWKLTLAYDGTPYHGWQVQPGLATVQGALSDAIHRTTGERVLPQGSGRTDAGVHALGQVASFALHAAVPAGNLHRALNRCLPPSIRVLSVEQAADSFHARHSAVRKTYEYRIFPLSRADGDADFETRPENICPPTLAPYVWPCPWPLDLALLNDAARHILGEHDFTSFAANDPELAERRYPLQDAAHQDWEMGAGTRQFSALRCIGESRWALRDGLLIYTVTGSGFLHHMVRNLVGTFVQVGARRLDANSLPSILAARDRSAAGPTAPASGLFLVSVEYPEPQHQGERPAAAQAFAGPAR
jgi:tRNA pseudouridine38-40 synthase